MAENQDGQEKSHRNAANLWNAGCIQDGRCAGNHIAGSRILPGTIRQIIGDIDGHIVKHDGDDYFMSARSGLQRPRNSPIKRSSRRAAGLS